MLQVTLTDAVSDPAAVMVHSEDAPVTNAAVVGSGRLDALAASAIVHELCLEVIDLVVREDYCLSSIIVALYKRFNSLPISIFFLFKLVLNLPKRV